MRLSVFGDLCQLIEAHPWSPLVWEDSCSFKPLWINWTVHYVKLKMWLFFFLLLKHFRYTRFSPNNDSIIDIWMMQNTKEWKRVTASQRRYFWHSVEREVIPLDDSFCLSHCRQEESAGGWKNYFSLRVEKQMQTECSCQNVGFLCPVSGLRICCIELAN